jgi:iron complex transport system substrate-binding protein
VSWRTSAFYCRQGAIIVALALLLFALMFRPAPVRAETSARRVLSLGPALTEMLFAVGGGDRLVGRTAFCNYPAAATKAPVVGAATGWNEEVVLSLKPDLILALEGQNQAVERLARLTKARLEVLPTTQLADVWRNLARIGALVGEGPRATRLVADLRAQVEARRKAAAARREHPTVFYMVWDEPLMAAGPRSYLGDLLTVAGGRNVVPAGPASYPTFSWEALLAADPDVLLAAKDRAAALQAMKARYPRMKAVKAGRLRTLPDDLISRPGPRVVQALDAVAAAIAPPARR